MTISWILILYMVSQSFRFHPAWEWWFAVATIDFDTLVLSTLALIRK